jgi:hypothetical protein
LKLPIIIYIYHIQHKLKEGVLIFPVAKFVTNHAYNFLLIQPVDKCVIEDDSSVTAKAIEISIGMRASHTSVHSIDIS